MTNDQLRAIRERWDGIGPGYSSEIDGRPSSIGVVAHHIKRVKQATSAAPTDIAALLEEVERLRGEQAQSVRIVTDGSVAVQYGPYPVDPSVLNGFYAHLRALGFSETDPDFPQ